MAYNINDELLLGKDTNPNKFRCFFCSEDTRKEIASTEEQDLSVDNHLVSLRYLSRFLQLFNEYGENRSHLRRIANVAVVPVCDNCFKMTKEFNHLYNVLEEAKLQVEWCVQRMHSMITKSKERDQSQINLPELEEDQIDMTNLKMEILDKMKVISTSSVLPRVVIRKAKIPGSPSSFSTFSQNETVQTSNLVNSVSESTTSPFAVHPTATATEPVNMSPNNPATASSESSTDSDAESSLESTTSPFANHTTTTTSEPVNPIQPNNTSIATSEPSSKAMETSTQTEKPITLDSHVQCSSERAPTFTPNHTATQTNNLENTTFEPSAETIETSTQTEKAITLDSHVNCFFETTPPFTGLPSAEPNDLANATSIPSATETMETSTQTEKAINLDSQVQSSLESTTSPFTANHTTIQTNNLGNVIFEPSTKTTEASTETDKPITLDSHVQCSSETAPPFTSHPTTTTEPNNPANATFEPATKTMEISTQTERPITLDLHVQSSLESTTSPFTAHPTTTTEQSNLTKAISEPFSCKPMETPTTTEEPITLADSDDQSSSESTKLPCTAHPSTAEPNNHANVSTKTMETTTEEPITLVDSDVDSSSLQCAYCRAGFSEKFPWMLHQHIFRYHCEHYFPNERLDSVTDQQYKKILAELLFKDLIPVNGYCSFCEKTLIQGRREGPPNFIIVKSHLVEFHFLELKEKLRDIQSDPNLADILSRCNPRGRVCKCGAYLPDLSSQMSHKRYQCKLAPDQMKADNANELQRRRPQKKLPLKRKRVTTDAGAIWFKSKKRKKRQAPPARPVYKTTSEDETSISCEYCIVKFHRTKLDRDKHKQGFTNHLVRFHPEHFFLDAMDANVVTKDQFQRIIHNILFPAFLPEDNPKHSCPMCPRKYCYNNSGKSRADFNLKKHLVESHRRELMGKLREILQEPDLMKTLKSLKKKGMSCPCGMYLPQRTTRAYHLKQHCKLATSQISGKNDAEDEVIMMDSLKVNVPETNGFVESASQIVPEVQASTSANSDVDGDCETLPIEMEDRLEFSEADEPEPEMSSRGESEEGISSYVHRDCEGLPMEMENRFERSKVKELEPKMTTSGESSESISDYVTSAYSEGLPMEHTLVATKANETELDAGESEEETSRNVEKDFEGLPLEVNNGLEHLKAKEPEPEMSESYKSSVEISGSIDKNCEDVTLELYNNLDPLRACESETPVGASEETSSYNNIDCKGLPIKMEGSTAHFTDGNEETSSDESDIQYLEEIEFYKTEPNDFSTVDFDS